MVGFYFTAFVLLLPGVSVRERVLLIGLAFYLLLELKADTFAAPRLS